MLANFCLAPFWVVHRPHLLICTPKRGEVLATFFWPLFGAVYRPPPFPFGPPFWSLIAALSSVPFRGYLVCAATHPPVRSVLLQKPAEKPLNPMKAVQKAIKPCRKAIKAIGLRVWGLLGGRRV